jgi:hypothetical protein
MQDQIAQSQLAALCEGVSGHTLAQGEHSYQIL